MRVFAGLPLPPEVRKRIAEWMQRRLAGSSSVKLVEEENLHVTLFFFGELDEAQLEKLASRVRDLKGKSFRASLGKPGCFPPKGPPRVYYIGLERGSEEVKDLHRGFLRAIAGLGYRQENRDFTPHITCGRARRSRSGRMPGPWGTLAEEAVYRPAFAMDRLILYESRLSPSGPTYLPLVTVLLSPDESHAP